VKIAFWSNANDMCGVSANLAAISVASVIRYPYTVLTMENYLSISNLGKAFFGRSYVNLLNDVGTNYYDGGGIEGLLRKILREDYYFDILQSFTKEVISKHLYYIPQSKVIHSKIFDYELNYCIHALLNMAEEFSDICFINAASQQNLSTKTILEESDLIVVNLCQKQSVLEDFFLNYSSLIPKSIFIISNYETHTQLNYKKIAYMYDIPMERITIIPNNDLYTNAYMNGNVVAFIKLNYECQKENSNYFFIQAIKKATYLIIKKTVEAVKQKELDLCLR
jgi:hypothetical protein